MRIAVCDDEKTMRETIVALLDEYCIERKLDLDYVSFSDYETLAPQIDAFDCFILDYQMPGMDGLTFAKTVRDACGADKTIILKLSTVISAPTKPSKAFRSKPKASPRSFARTASFSLRRSAETV